MQDGGTSADLAVPDRRDDRQRRSRPACDNGHVGRPRLKPVGWVEIETEFYRDIAAGLDDLVLLDGYRVWKSPHGDVVSFEDLDGLLVALVRHLVRHRKALSGSEIGFIRSWLELTQEELARQVGSDVQAIARYEKGRSRIPGPVDRLIRLLALQRLDGRVPSVAKFLSDLANKPVDEDRSLTFSRQGGRWHAVERPAFVGASAGRPPLEA